MQRLFILLAAFFPISATVSAPAIPGFERLSNRGQTQDAGEVLLGELSCVKCHTPPEHLEHRFQDYVPPSLQEAGTRLRLDFLQDFLIDPTVAHPAGRMPGVLGGLAEADKKAAVEALAAFLASRGSEISRLPGSVENGKKLFELIGCAACHAPDAKHTVPLGHVRNKYRPGALAAFLRDPLHVRPAARMPAIPLQEGEAADLEAYLTKDSTPIPATKITVPHIARGRQLYQEYRCAACHDKAEKTPLAKPLLELTESADGCLSETPQPRLPLFKLSHAQRTAIIAALKALPHATALSDPARLARFQETLNCVSCHSSDDRHDTFFTANREDMGDEGRLPPSLTGVGRKLLPQALREVLNGNGVVRPYMNTRMPDYGHELANAFTELFTIVDAGERTTARVNPASSGRNALGRELVGVQGLNCIACHSLNGHRSLGIEAVDLATAPERLRLEWFRAYLLDPAKFRPGTRMPSFFTDGKSVHPAGGADPSHQIEGIWVYLNEVDQTRLPVGMENPTDFVLAPKERPIVFRTFMKGVGMQAIAVGFPEKIHAAFDARDLRWALVWKGKFVNAEGTWDTRSAPLTVPLGGELITLPSGPSIALLSSPSEPWPIAGVSDGFAGYRLDRLGRPTFHYRVGTVEVADSIKPSKENVFLRTIQLRALALNPEGYWLLAATGKQIEPDGEGYRIDGRWRTTLPNTRLILKDDRGFTEARAPISFVDGIATIIQEITW